MEQTVSPNPIIQLAPMLMLSVVYGGIAIAIGRRKVQNLALWVFLCVIPILNILALAFLISKTDKSVLNDLADLRSRLDLLSPPKA